MLFQTCDCHRRPRHRQPESIFPAKLVPSSRHTTQPVRLAEGRADNFTYSPGLATVGTVILKSTYVHMWRASTSLGIDHCTNPRLEAFCVQAGLFTLLKDEASGIFIMLKSFTFHYQTCAGHEMRPGINSSQQSCFGAAFFSWHQALLLSTSRLKTGSLREGLGNSPARHPSDDVEHCSIDA
jgi:hypothetical protein